MKKREVSRILSIKCRKLLLQTSLCFLALLAFTSNLQARAVMFSKAVSANMSNCSLRKVLGELKRQTGTYFMFNEDKIDADVRVDLKVNKEPLYVALNNICTQANLSYEQVEDYVLITPKRSTGYAQKQAQGQSFILKGSVVSENGTKLPGVSIALKGTGTGTASNIDGDFTLKVPGNGGVIYVSFIGMEPQIIKITKETGKLQIVMKTNAQKLDDVIITGYQTISKERATGSFGVVTSDNLEKKLSTSVINKLEGQVAGLSNYGNSYSIRGASTLRGTTKPLIILDNAPFEGAIEDINPADISNVTVLKDATAASIYGARSANGVIVITTKNGKTGPTNVTYTGNIHISPLPDRSYMNLMNSQELVQFQTELFDLSHNATYDANKSMNDVYKLLYDREQNLITEADLQAKLDVYRNSDRYDQVLKEFVRKRSIVQQHNVAIRGGSDIYKYSYSLNYQKNNPYEKEQSSDLVGFNIKNSIKFFKWLDVDFGMIGNQSKSDYNNGIGGYGLLNGGSASYYMLRDDKGRPVQWYNGKSQAEIDRLKSIGLKDESYYPVNEMDKSRYSTTSNYLNLNINLRLKLYEGLTLDLRGQKEKTVNSGKTFQSKDCMSVKTLYNNATTLPDANTGLRTHYIPDGGILTRTNSNKESYTLRAQLNYNNTFDSKHQISAIVGAERRQVQSKGDGFMQFGYDDYNLGHKFIDEQTLFELNQRKIKTEALDNLFSYQAPTPYITDLEDRFVSFYGNASYTFNKNLSATASIRMDQSNLFGTDPKYQYRPLWSLGTQYIALENKFGWLDRLAFRLTYGVNGNIPKSGGPFLVTKLDEKPAYYSGEFYSYVVSPPNSGLRWEKTNTTNFGVDFSMFNSRLTGSVELYNKQTKDLLGTRAADETLGWSELLVNYGEMYNRGVEVSLQSENLRIGEFSWTSSATFSYNKNKLTSIENPETSPYSYFKSPQNREGYPMGAMFNTRYAGLNELGQPTSYTKEGKLVTKEGELVKEDLVYSGTSVPPFSASLTNGFSYKGIDLSFMFVYYGGNVLRDVAASYLIDYYPVMNFQSNIDRNYLNYWKQPGDENLPNINPAFAYNVYGSDVQSLWKSADKHIQKGDFIRLRDLTLGYTLPKRLINKISMKGARISFQARNLWYWAANDKNLDPEAWSGTSLKPSRGTKAIPTYSFGLSFNF